MYPDDWNPKKPIPPDIRYRPKKSLGYSTCFSTSRVRPVTGREWVYTATDEQMKVLYAIEQGFASMEAHKYNYAMRELHTTDESGDFDGWSVSIRSLETGKTLSRKYEGFPPSAGSVLRALNGLLTQLRVIEKIANGKDLANENEAPRAMEVSDDA